MNLRIYVTTLELNSELLNIANQELVLKDTIINNCNNQIANRNSIINDNNNFIKYQKLELDKSDKWGKSQEQLKIKYKKISETIPY